MSAESKLAILLYSEITHFDVLIRKDEDTAFELLDRNKLIHYQAIEKNNGKILREEGTEVLAQFETVKEAINCSLNIQEAWSEIRQKKLRIGLHQGELRVADNIVTGDGVNVVKGLISLAPGGSIYVSEIIGRNTEERPDLTKKYMGERRLPGVAYPIRVHKLVRANFPTRSLKSTRMLRYSMVGFIVFVIIFSVFSAVKGCEARKEMKIKVQSAE